MSGWRHIVWEPRKTETLLPEETHEANLRSMLRKGTLPDEIRLYFRLFYMMKISSTRDRCSVRFFRVKPFVLLVMTLMTFAALWLPVGLGFFLENESALDRQINLVGLVAVLLASAVLLVLGTIFWLNEQHFYEEQTSRMKGKESKQ